MREDEDAADDDEADRPREEIGVQLGDLAVEPELVGEVVGERDQPRVERHLRQAVAVERRGGRRAEPPAHPRDSTREVVASLLAREAVHQQLREHSRVAPHAVGARGALRGVALADLDVLGRARAACSRPSAISRSSTAPRRPSNVVHTGVPSATASRFIVPPAETTTSA